MRSSQITKKTFYAAFPAQNDDNFSKETNLQTSRKNSSQRKTSRFQQNQKLDLLGIDSICKPCLNAYFCRNDKICNDNVCLLRP